MDRIEIYDRYIEPYVRFRNSENDRIKVVGRYNEIRRVGTVVEVQELGVRFAFIEVFLNASQYKSSIIKVDIPKVFHGATVLGIWNISTYSEAYGCVLDLSDTDLSNILHFEIHGNSIFKSNILNIKMPHGSNKLKPVCIELSDSSLSLSAKNIAKFMGNIDFSCTKYAHGILRNSGVEEFDFSLYDFSNLKYSSYMFESCFRLRRVSGSIGCKELDIANMFDNCSKLEIIQKEVFQGIEIKNMSYAFNNCHKLKDLYLYEHNIKGTYRGSATMAFAECRELRPEGVSEFLATLIKTKSRLEQVFSGEYSVVKIGRVAATLYDMSCITRLCNIRILDLSKVSIDYYAGTLFTVNHDAMRNTGILDITARKPDLRDSIYSVLDHFNSKNVNKCLDIECVPEVVVVNKSYNIKDLDREVFEIVSIEGSTDIDIENKIKLVRLIGDGKRYMLVI